MSFSDLGAARGGAPAGLGRGPQHNQSVAVEYEESPASHHVPMQKNGSASTASMSAGSSTDEDPIGGGGSGRRRNGSSGSSLSTTVTSLSGTIARYQVSFETSTY